MPDGYRGFMPDRIDVPRDGDCFYSALLGALAANGDHTYTTVQSLRDAMAAFVRALPALSVVSKRILPRPDATQGSGIMSPFFTDRQTALANQMSRRGQWTDGERGALVFVSMMARVLDPVAPSTVFSVRTHNAALTESSPPRIYEGMLPAVPDGASPFADGTPRVQLHLYYNGRDHYGYFNADPYAQLVSTNSESDPADVDMEPEGAGPNPNQARGRVSIGGTSLHIIYFVLFFFCLFVFVFCFRIVFFFFFFSFYLSRMAMT